MRRATSAAGIALLALILSACAGEDDRPYLTVGGGGFVFNYRLAQAMYGINVRPEKDPPAGAVIEARFDDPAGGEPIVLSKPARPGPGQISFQTPPVHGVEKGRPYLVQIVLRDASGAELQRIDKSFVSDLDQSVLPAGPLTVGPGYHRPGGLQGGGAAGASGAAVE